MRNKGIRQYRFKQNPTERIFAELWEEINERNRIGYGILDYMLAETTNMPNGEVTDRDRIVAATVIQWLGSPVGQAFLNEVNEKRKEI